MVLKGYFAFLIVFAAFALLISLAQLNLNSKVHDSSKAIWTERFYRVQMNVKEVLIEAARQGALEGFNAYCAVTPADKFDGSLASEAVRGGIAVKTAEVFGASPVFDDYIEVSVLCNGLPAESGSCSDIVRYPDMPMGGMLTCGHELREMILRDTEGYADVNIILVSKDGLHTAKAELPTKIKVVYQ